MHLIKNFQIYADLDSVSYKQFYLQIVAVNLYAAWKFTICGENPEPEPPTDYENFSLSHRTTGLWC